MNLEISQFVLIVTVAVRILTAFLFLAFLIPLFIKEAKVKNGLRTLRYQLLTTGMIIFFVNTSGLLIIVGRYFGMNLVNLTDIVSYINTFGFLIYAIIKIRIYTQQYTPENKLYHAQRERIEEREKTRDNRQRRARIKLNSDRRKETRRRKHE
jgi:hypothetical protein